ncbi:MAG: hypothetical protein CM15mP55_2840 [Hyphomicrobiales bacterium]|nr:MAG: hypothetical protein CM15mP55_2840 [Hyphomicrobiales bacterium]
MPDNAPDLLFYAGRREAGLSPRRGAAGGPCSRPLPKHPMHCGLISTMTRRSRARQGYRHAPPSDHFGGPQNARRHFERAGAAFAQGGRPLADLPPKIDAQVPRVSRGGLAGFFGYDLLGPFGRIRYRTISTGKAPDDLLAPPGPHAGVYATVLALF